MQYEIMNLKIDKIGTVNKTPIVRSG